MQYWEIIAGWRWIVDAHGSGRRYIVHSHELLSAFLELEARLLAPTLGTSANLKF